MGFRARLRRGFGPPFPLLVALGVVAMGGAAVSLDPQGTDQTREDLTRRLWPRERIEQAIRDVDRQKADGLLSEAAYARRKQMLTERLAGTYHPESLSVTNPPLNFIQNGGFEDINPNSARNRSRWLWWGGWDWGGDYENMWEERPEWVHSGKRSARIRCTGTTGRIGINTPPLPAVPGVQEYRLTLWAKGEGENQLFINFEGGATGTIREKVPEQWTAYTVTGKPVADEKTYQVFLYVTGAGTIWLDDVTLVPEGGILDE